MAPTFLISAFLNIGREDPPAATARATDRTSATRNAKASQLVPPSEWRMPEELAEQIYRVYRNFPWRSNAEVRLCDMHQVLSDEFLDQIFRQARTHSGWLDKPVSDDMLRQIYDQMKWGPTSANTSPARFLFLRTPEAKQRLLPALAPLNVEKALAAPVTAIVGYDLRFYDKLPKLFPHNPKMHDLFANSPELAEVTAKRNSSLQGAYLIIAARALGLDCGPMSGFDNGKVDHEFFGAGREEHGCDQEFFPTTHVRSNFLCNLGYGDPVKLYPRNPRLDFEEACVLL